MTKKAVVLLSGGMDSATTLAIAKAQGFETYALSFSYGQRQAAELQAAEAVVRALEPTEHRVITIDLRVFGGSALTDDIAVPKERAAESIGNGVPVTYVPARNTIFLSYALAWAEVLGAYHIFIGVNAVDYSGYPDCRPQFIEAFEAMANLGTAGASRAGRRIQIDTPLMNLSKAEIVKRGTELGLDYGLTLSCYDPEGQLACGACDACQLRRQGFAQAEIPDPTRYVTAS